MKHQQSFTFNDETSKHIRTLKNLGELYTEHIADEPKPYRVQWSHFENPWDINEAYGDTLEEAVMEVYDQLYYILWQECNRL